MEKRVVQSFDVFDTLIGRLHKDPKSIFEIVERDFPFPRFKQHRMGAESSSDGTLESTYRKFCEITGLSKEEAEKLKEFEVKTELDQVFPILANLVKVNHQDILVSDSYYDEATLRKILQKVGFDKEVDIFISPRGKSSGKIWDQLLERYEIKSHLGDNDNSDYLIPATHHINCQLYEDSQYSFLEEQVALKGLPDLSHLMRAVRLSNPYLDSTPHYYIWDEQSQFNLPILILTSLHLRDYCQEMEKNRILFTTRDCCHLIEIFKRLFPAYDSISFTSSRVLYRKPPQYFIDYVKSVYTNECVIVDVHGSGKTCIEFFQEQMNVTPDYFVLTGQWNHDYKIHEMIYDYGDHVERINYDIQGTVIDFNQSGPVRLDAEYDLQYVLPAHAAMKKALELIHHYHFEKYDEQLFHFLLKQLENQSVLPQFVAHVREHGKMPFEK